MKQKTRDRCSGYVCQPNALEVRQAARGVTKFREIYAPPIFTRAIGSFILIFWLGIGLVSIQFCGNQESCCNYGVESPCVERQDAAFDVVGWSPALFRWGRGTTGGQEGEGNPWSDMFFVFFARALLSVTSGRTDEASHETWWIVSFFVSRARDGCAAMILVLFTGQIVR